MSGRMPQWTHLVADKFEAGNETPVSQVTIDDADIIDDFQWLILETFGSDDKKIHPKVVQGDRIQLHLTDERGGHHEVSVYKDAVNINVYGDDSDWLSDPDGVAWDFLMKCAQQ